MPALCNVVKNIAHEAGQIILTHFEEGAALSHDLKSDGSPVTTADREAERFIAMKLREDFPDFPVVGEESAAAGEIPSLEGAEYFWLLDPLDGTKEFIKGGKEFTVNIALIQNNVPLLGVIYAPALGEIFLAYGEGTATRWSEETGKEKQIHVRKPVKAGITVAASKNREFEETDKFLESYKVEKLVRIGSSLKICAVASGKADLYPCFGPTSEWDTAAGQAILTAAGGELVTFGGKPLRYGDKKGSFINAPFIARTPFMALD